MGIVVLINFKEEKACKGDWNFGRFNVMSLISMNENKNTNRNGYVSKISNELANNNNINNNNCTSINSLNEFDSAISK